MMAQSVLCYNVVIVGKYLNKGSWVSEARRKDHPQELDDLANGLTQRIPIVEERRDRLDLEQDNDVCVRPPGTPHPHSARLTSAERGNQNMQEARTISLFN